MSISNHGIRPRRDVITNTYSAGSLTAEIAGTILKRLGELQAVTDKATARQTFQRAVSILHSAQFTPGLSDDLLLARILSMLAVLEGNDDDAWLRSISQATRILDQKPDYIEALGLRSYAAHQYALVHLAKRDERSAANALDITTRDIRTIMTLHPAVVQYTANYLAITYTVVHELLNNHYSDAFTSHIIDSSLCAIEIAQLRALRAPPTEARDSLYLNLSTLQTEVSTAIEHLTSDPYRWWPSPLELASQALVSWHGTDQNRLPDWAWHNRAIAEYRLALLFSARDQTSQAIHYFHSASANSVRFAESELITDMRSVLTRGPWALKANIEESLRIAYVKQGDFTAAVSHGQLAISALQQESTDDSPSPDWHIEMAHARWREADTLQLAGDDAIAAEESTSAVGIVESIAQQGNETSTFALALLAQWLPLHAERLLKLGNVRDARDAYLRAYQFADHHFPGQSHYNPDFWRAMVIRDLAGTYDNRPDGDLKTSLTYYQLAAAHLETAHSDNPLTTGQMLELAHIYRRIAQLQQNNGDKVGVSVLTRAYRSYAYALDVEPPIPAAAIEAADVAREISRQYSRDGSLEQAERYLRFALAARSRALEWFPFEERLYRDSVADFRQLALQLSQRGAQDEAFALLEGAALLCEELIKRRPRYSDVVELAEHVFGEMTIMAVDLDRSDLQRQVGSHWISFMMSIVEARPADRAALSGLSQAQLSHVRRLEELGLEADASALVDEIQKHWSDYALGFPDSPTGAFYNALWSAERADQLVKYENSDLASSYWYLAIHFYSATLEMEPWNMAAHFNRGLVFLSMKDWYNAYLDFDQVLQREPHNIHARSQRDIAAMELGIE